MKRGKKVEIRLREVDILINEYIATLGDDENLADVFRRAMKFYINHKNYYYKDGEKDGIRWYGTRYGSRQKSKQR